MGVSRFSILAAALLALTPAAPVVGQPAPEPIEVASKPIGSFFRSDGTKERFGALEFRGGLVLSSKHERFGGFSGLRMLDAERFIAITDRGYWLRGRILADGDRPKGISEAEIAPMIGSSGRPLATSWYDTESLALGDDGWLYVGIEQVNRIVRFNYRRSGLRARAELVAAPPAIRDLPKAYGLEALARVPKDLPLAGTLIAISERALDKEGNIRGFLIGGPAPGEFSVARDSGFDITDAAITPSGRLLILERRLSLLTFSMRIRAFPLAELQQGAVLKGEILIEAGGGYEVDNMEALAVHESARGETILTVMSDDNFFGFQRTLLLRFALIED